MRQDRGSHFTGVCFPAAVNFPKPSSADDPVHTEVVHAQLWSTRQNKDVKSHDVRVRTDRWSSVTSHSQDGFLKLRDETAVQHGDRGGGGGSMGGDCLFTLENLMQVVMSGKHKYRITSQYKK